MISAGAGPSAKNAMKRPFIANRMLRSVGRFFAAVLIGVGLTLAGQSYSEQLNDPRFSSDFARVPAKPVTEPSL